MSAPSTSGLSVELVLRVIDVKYVALLFFLTREVSWHEAKIKGK